jgi:hypothetical protein
VEAEMTDARRTIARYGGADPKEADERRREMADYLAYRGNVGRRAGELYPSSTKAAEDMLDAMTPAQLTLLELEMHGGERAGHESDYDPFAR